MGQIKLTLERLERRDLPNGGVPVVAGLISPITPSIVVYIYYESPPSLVPKPLPPLAVLSPSRLPPVVLPEPEQPPEPDNPVY